MNAATRTDVHRPSTLDPADYVFVGEGDLHHSEGFEWWDVDLISVLQAVVDDPEIAATYERIQQFEAERERLDSRSLAASAAAVDVSGVAADLKRLLDERKRGANIDRRADTGRGGYATCQHCGHRGLRYLAFFLHRPTGEILGVGQDCAEKLNLESRSQLQIRRFREARRREAKLAAFTEAHPQVVAFLDEYRAKVEAGERRANDFLHSISFKLKKWGELSEKQVAAVERSIEREAEWAAEREAEEADEPDPAPAIEGRIEITGKIVSSKYKDTQFGSVLKMVVLDDRGFKVWGTQPDGLLAEAPNPYSDDATASQAGWIEKGEKWYRPADRGDRVRFTATVTRSDRDETFGFFKRPTKAEVIDPKE